MPRSFRPQNMKPHYRGALHFFASPQQPAGFLCKKVAPGQHRREAPFVFARVFQQKRHDVENVASAGANPAASTTFLELKPQQTGTGLLIRHGEVATTSGSTNLLPGRLMSRTPPFEGGRVGASPAPATSFWEIELRPLGGETGSRLAYTQPAEGQHLPERPFPCASLLFSARIEAHNHAAALKDYLNTRLQAKAPRQHHRPVSA
jgi:hypothetical protein